MEAVTAFVEVRLCGREGFFPPRAGSNFFSTVAAKSSMETLTVAVKRANLNNKSFMSASNDVAFAEFAVHESGDTLCFYEVEGQVLALWDQLNELRLEQALLEAQITSSSGAFVMPKFYNTR